MRIVNFKQKIMKIYFGKCPYCLWRVTLYSDDTEIEKISCPYCGKQFEVKIDGRN